MEQIVIGSLVWFPLSVLGDEEVAEIKKKYTLTIEGYDVGGGKKASAHTRNSTGFFGGEVDDSPKPTIINQWRLSEDGKSIGLPMKKGMELANAILVKNPDTEIKIDLCQGNSITTSKKPDPYHPLASPNQRELMESTIAMLDQKVVVLVKAPTGSGKTVVALNAIATLGRTALIIVSTRVLARQWEREAQLHLGLGDDDIGHLEGGKCDFIGKKLVIAVMVNLVLKEFEPAFYKAFGMVVWDESHRLGAAGFSKTLPLFSAQYRLALTATPKRKDGAEQVFLDYFGSPSVSGTSDALGATATVIHRQTTIKNWDRMPTAVLVNKLTRDDARNSEIANFIVRLYNAGRTILVLSDRIEQLESLLAKVAIGGVALTELGLFTRQKTIDNKRKSVKDSDLDIVRLGCRVIFSTYGMGKEGLDIPRLDTGIDASPRADGVQAIGRIRRPFPNKKHPQWFTICDEGVPIFVGYTRARVTDYKSATVVVRKLDGFNHPIQKMLS